MNPSSAQEGRPGEQGRATTTSAVAPDTHGQDGEAVQYPPDLNLGREQGVWSISLKTLNLPRSIFATTCCSTFTLHQHGTYTPLTLSSLSYFVTCLATFEQRPWLLAQAPSQSHDKSERAMKENAKFYKRAELAANEASFLIEVTEIMRQGTVRLVGVFCFDVPHITSHAHQDQAQAVRAKHPAIPSKTAGTMPKNPSRDMLSLPSALPAQRSQIQQPGRAKIDPAKKVPRTMFTPPPPQLGATAANEQTSKPAFAQGGMKQNETQGEGQWSHKTWIDISVLRREAHFLMKRDHAIWKCAEHGNVIEIGVVNLSPSTV
ncbi:hypothetical protein BP6252_10384 [Coleophoma cylindrospora]|uniref:Uncharacterized protein n=1 Tax=Coleophoma cylindrospora TaxID=1849047 RepID=A0A3D8QSD3_9HELO|nr:hypothetical protein BP6252_10384 [Coleophoma cylindrospora]